MATSRGDALVHLSVSNETTESEGSNDLPGCTPPSPPKQMRLPQQLLLFLKSTPSRIVDSLRHLSPATSDSPLARSLAKATSAARHSAPLAAANAAVWKLLGRSRRGLPVAVSVLLTLALTVGLVLRGLDPSVHPPRSIQEAAKDKAPPDSGSIIPGAHITTAAAVRELRWQLTCMPNEGFWERAEEPRPLPWNDPHLDTCDQQWVSHGDGSLAGGAADAVTRADSWLVRDSLKWRWRLLDKCTASWRPFEQEGFCGALDTLGGNILFVGGPTAGTMFQNLQNHLALGCRLAGKNPPLVVTPDPCKEWEDDGKLPDGTHYCKAIWSCRGQENGTYVFYARNDRLTVREDGPEVNSWGVFLPWFDLMKTWKVKILVLSRGEPFPGNKLLEKQLRETISAVRREYPHVLIVYRSATMAHKDCAEHAVPYKNIFELPSAPNELRTRNMVARGVVEEHGGVFLDVEHLSSLRPDGHVGELAGEGKDGGSSGGSSVNTHSDCVNYCSPGPVDVWTQMLHNALLLLTELDPA